MTNATATDWNIVCDQNITESITFQKIDWYLNGNTTENLLINISRMSYYNNSAATNKFIPFRANWTINNGTPINFGECLWAFLDDSKQTKGWQLINWTSMK
jgi:hypothetical protein